MSMGIGYGLSEELKFDEKTGRPLNNNLLDYKLSTVMDHPDLRGPVCGERGADLGPFGNEGPGRAAGLFSGRRPSATPFCNATGVAIDVAPITPHVLYRRIQGGRADSTKGG